jgi:hypothetical protein
MQNRVRIIKKKILEDVPNYDDNFDGPIVWTATRPFNTKPLDPILSTVRKSIQ